jgi:hypothetical protein
LISSIFSIELTMSRLSNNFNRESSSPCATSIINFF